MATREDIVAAARSWVAVPWRHQGRSRNGIDCVGLVVMVCKDLGLSSYDSTAYGRAPDARMFLWHFTAGGAVRINPKDAADGDLIAFQQTGFPCHCGIRSTRYEAAYVIHAIMTQRRVVEEQMFPDSPVVAAYRLPGVV